MLALTSVLGAPLDFEAARAGNEAVAGASATVANNVSAELQRRIEAQHEMGFDALYLAAYLRTYGP